MQAKINHISYYQKELNYFLRFPYGLGIWWEHRSGHGSGTWPESTDQSTLYPFPSENSPWPHVHEGGGLWMQRYCLKRDFISVYTCSTISMPHFSHQLPLILRQMSYIELQKQSIQHFKEEFNGRFPFLIVWSYLIVTVMKSRLSRSTPPHPSLPYLIPRS